MKRRDMAVIMATALVTAAATLTLWHSTGQAHASQLSLMAKATAQPVLKVSDVELRLAVEHKVYKPNQKPTAVLTATNKGDKDATLTCVINMMTTATASRYSRMMILPKKAASHPCDVVLKPGETRSFKWATGIALKPGTTATFQITAAGKTIHAASCSTPPVNLRNGLALPKPKPKQS